MGETNNTPTPGPGVPGSPRPWWGALAGVLAAAVGLGLGEMTAAGLGVGSPVVAVGDVVVDRSPQWLTEFAVAAFGEYDKGVLLSGIVVVLGVLAAVAGAVSIRRPVAGRALVVLLGVVAAAAAIGSPAGGVLDVAPPVVVVVTGLATLRLLLDRLPMRDAAAEGSGPGRRGVLVLGAGALGVAAVSGVLSRVLGGGSGVASASRSEVQLPRPSDPAPRLPSDAVLEVDGLSPFRTPNDEFYRVDTALTVPRLSADDWSLRVHGMVDREMRVTYRQLLSMPLVERDITMTCVSNPVGGPYIGTARWLGYPLRDLLERAGVHPGANQVVSRSSDGMTIGTPTSVLTDGRDALLVVGMNGQPLPLEHGFPVRMVVPGLYGYVSATKWVTELELTTFDAYDAYWVERGWAQQAPIKTASRIDTPRSGGGVQAGTTVPVAGVAWAQRRGIARVEVRVDGGAWQEAQLSGDAGDDVWRQWVWQWPVGDTGQHRLEVRATDGDGHTQPEQRVDPIPDGATGWHAVVVDVT